MIEYAIETEITYASLHAAVARCVHGLLDGRGIVCDSITYIEVSRGGLS